MRWAFKKRQHLIFQSVNDRKILVLLRFLQSENVPKQKNKSRRANVYKIRELKSLLFLDKAIKNQYTTKEPCGFVFREAAMAALDKRR